MAFRRKWKTVIEKIMNPLWDRAIRYRRSHLGPSLKDPKALLEGPDIPQHLGIELTNLCNANCVFCAYQYQERSIQTLPFDLFQKATREYASLGGGSLGLTPVVGDSLIDKEIVKKVRFARSLPQIKEIGITTNAILLTRERFEQLVEAGLSYMYVSMSGFSAEEYKRIYRNNSYKRVTNNLESIAQSPMRSQCYIEISLRTDHPFHWIKLDYKKFKKLGYPITRNWFFDSWSGRIRTIDLPGIMFLRPNPSKTIPCVQLYDGTNILSNGMMTACGCRNLNNDKELFLGDIREKAIDTPWRDGTLKRIRQKFLDGNPPDICQDCSVYSPISEERARHWRYSNQKTRPHHSIDYHKHEEPLPIDLQAPLAVDRHSGNVCDQSK